ncbi:hypothetical protein ACFOU2_16350 [Bacillus songklensis]|uniref:Uncharacterized protein n=1 Tax=Bacillus songklensis TaxID=1069116 RepID=A0ABV8B3R0_9BACI
MNRYKDLFRIEKYEDESHVCFSKTLNGKEIEEPYTIPESIFSRIMFIGRAYTLHYLSVLEPGREFDLNKTQAQAFIDELHFLLSIVNDRILDHYVNPLIKFVESIIFHPKAYSLSIQGNS